MKKFEFLEHTADIKFRAYGKDEKEVWENACCALFHAMCPSEVKSKTKKEISVNGNDFESLLYNVLEEFLFLFDSKHFLPEKIKIKEFDTKRFAIVANVFGDDAMHYKDVDHIKSVTYHDMIVTKEKSHWMIQVVLDV